MSDTEFLNDSDQDVSESHSKFIEAVSQLDKGQRIKKAERSEPTLEVSEFHLVKSGVTDKDAVRIQDLAKSLGRKGHHANVIKKLEAAQKKIKVLPKPLEKPVAERIKRIAGYEQTKNQVQKWNSTIWKNRTADHLVFPLPRLSMESQSGTRKPFQDRFRTMSELEKKLAELEPKKEESEDREKEFSLTLEEIIQKKNEAARFRARQSYREAKANRQKKIRSKKHHRIQRKEKTKRELKEFEELQKTDPEAALKKLELLEVDRARERMSLRHKSTGQWAKNKLIKAKYDKATRQALSEQLSISRELTQKVRTAHDSDDDENDVVQSATCNVGEDENPWTKATKTESEIDEFISSYRKYWDERNKTAKDKEKNDVSIPTVVARAPSVESRKTVQNGKQDCAESGIDAAEAVSDANSTIEKSKKKSSKEEELANATAENDRKIDGSSKSNDSKSTGKSVSKKKTKKTGVSKKADSTSRWEVQSVSSEDDDRSKRVPEVESLDKLFDKMEEMTENAVKTKLQSIKRKYDSDSVEIPRKKRTAGGVTKDKIEDDYKGLRENGTVQRPILDEPMMENADAASAEPSERDISSADARDSRNLPKVSSNKSNFPPTKAAKGNMEIDANKYINVKAKHLRTEIPDTENAAATDALDDSETEDRDEQRDLMSEAFADDDVVDEFRKEKREIKESEAKDGSSKQLAMPGWGTWAGTGVSAKKSHRKKPRLIVNPPKDAPRRDDNKGDVIIYESGNEKIGKHRVKELPYPFASVKDFEASIRAPVGREFVTENIHRRLTQSAVQTKLGTVIEPLDESVLIDVEALKKMKRLEKKDKKSKEQVPDKIRI